MSWTDERVDLLAKLWGEGLSASQIAGQLGGVTRNAVIGKVHRLKLEGRAKAPIPAQDAAKPKSAEPAAADTVVEIDMPARFLSAPSSGRAMPRTIGGGGGGGSHGATALKFEEEVDAVAEPVARALGTGEVVPISRNLTLVQLNDRTCKWPLGDPLSPDFRFCGNHSNDASPYCLYHARIAFQPVSERRRIR